MNLHSAAQSSAVLSGAPPLDALQATGNSCRMCPIPVACGDWLEGLPGALLDSVLEQRQLAAGAALYMAGQKRTSVWVISDGALKTCEVDVEGREQVVGFHGAGDVLGIERIEIPEHRGFATALEPTRVCCVSVDRLVARMTTVPELWREVLAIAARQIASAREMHSVLGQLQTTQRLAWFLLKGPGVRRDGCDCSGTNSIYLPMQRQDIASFLGMTLETVSRVFSALQKDGVIVVHGRTIELLDPAALAARAYGGHC
jgi:CRP/FNR family transcriptional regulator, anaerobic regulatory protein